MDAVGVHAVKHRAEEHDHQSRIDAPTQEPDRGWRATAPTTRTTDTETQFPPPVHPGACVRNRLDTTAPQKTNSGPDAQYRRMMFLSLSGADL